MVTRDGDWGGPWTEDKLDRVRRYLEAYMTALKNQPFELIYIDAFAGTGFLQTSTPRNEEPGLFGEENVRAFAKGSARLAVEVEPPFDRYVFVEHSKDKLRALERELTVAVPSLRERMEFRREDANAALVEVCRTTDWRTTRAVAFLDPFAMSVDWSTIELIAGTMSIDLWYLFPFMAVNRVLTRSGDIPPSWQNRLDRMLPDTDWRTEFYAESPQPGLFPDTEPAIVKEGGVERMEVYVQRHMRRIFAGVAAHALPLHNSRNQCLFLLTFACGNSRGAPVALRIANNILGR
jgi:three-Cys-motif partner protein